MKTTKENLEVLIKNCKTDKQILKVLDNAKVKYTNDTIESNYFNLHLSNGMRIYKTPRKRLCCTESYAKSKIRIFWHTNIFCN